jgi:exosome complex component CSL4
MDKQKVMVGEYLGTIEEFMPGEGTYSEDGKIYSAIIGYKDVDPGKHVAAVRGKTLPSMMIGQTVFGEVCGFKTNMVTIIAGKIVGQKGVIDEKTTLYVSNIADSYIDKPEDYFGIGDIVKAKVIKMDANLVDVSTKGEDLGVVKAFCKNCRHPLTISKKQPDKLQCPSCSRIEKRKMAVNYGNVSEY